MIIPRGASISGKLSSGRGVKLSAKKVRLAPGIEAVQRGDSVYLLARNGTISGQFTCGCDGGSGDCGIIKTTDQKGQQAVSCDQGKCTGSCNIYVNIPPAKVQ